MLEVEGLQAAEFHEELHKRQGLMTHPYVYCLSCHGKSPIQYAKVGSTKKLAINQKSVFANKCAGGTHSSLEMLCCMQDLPPPVSVSVYREHARAVYENSSLQAQASMKQARQEAGQHYNAEPEETSDILISFDGTWIHLALWDSS